MKPSNSKQKELERLYARLAILQRKLKTLSNSIEINMTSFFIKDVKDQIKKLKEKN